jgi:hypothetical protein
MTGRHLHVTCHLALSVGEQARPLGDWPLWVRAGSSSWGTASVGEQARPLVCG